MSKVDFRKSPCRCPGSRKNILDFFFEWCIIKLSVTTELVPAVRATSILSELPKDSSGCEAGSYLRRVETSLSAFSCNQLREGGEHAQSLTGRGPMKGRQRMVERLTEKEEEVV